MQATYMCGFLTSSCMKRLLLSSKYFLLCSSDFLDSLQWCILTCVQWLNLFHNPTIKLNKDIYLLVLANVEKRIHDIKKPFSCSKPIQIVGFYYWTRRTVAKLKIAHCSSYFFSYSVCYIFLITSIHIQRKGSIVSARFGSTSLLHFSANSLEPLG